MPLSAARVHRMQRSGSTLPSRLASLVLAALLMGAGPASALCIGACSCSASVTAIVFAPYNPLVASADDSAGTVRVSCDGIAGLAIPYTISLGAGTSSSIADRKMASGANRLSYNVYTSAAYATVVGDGVSGGTTLSGTIALNVLGLSTPQDWTLYGRIPGSQKTVAPGNYADTLTLTLTYF